MRDITELPHDLFLLVTSYLSPQTCVLCRSVSHRWLAAFTDGTISLLLLRWNFPRCREMRVVVAAASLSNSSFLSPAQLAEIPASLRLEAQNIAKGQQLPESWATVFAKVARRYHHLRQAQPRVVEKLELAGHGQEKPSDFSFYGVAPWNRFLRLDEKTANFHYPDPAWWYSQEDGVLVYPAEDLRGDGDAHSNLKPCDGNVYRVLDLADNVRVPVPFDVRQKHIRRVRLTQGVLVFEWAEALPYHQLNDREVVHRHFVTAFDVIRVSSTDPNQAPVLAADGSPGWTWSVKFRSEWKLHFLGLPLNRSDRFFSAHTATHYAVYFWQPNRSLYQDDPIEQLAVWDISSSSPYRPSEDPTGDQRPAPIRAQTTPTGLWSGGSGKPSAQASKSADSLVTEIKIIKDASLATATAGPQVIRRMAWRELDFYGLRQRATPRLRNLTLDDQNLYVVEEEHRWSDGQHSSLSPPRVHLVRCTGIPIVPTPASKQEAFTNDHQSLSSIINGPVFGPIWVDACGADGDINMSFCRRLASNTADTVTSHWTNTWPPLPLGSLNIGGSEYLEAQIRGSRPASAVATWPWALTRDCLHAPCWRHEDFPYLTVTEMIDAAAGVRVTARHCFMLETLSVHVRPGMISVKEGRLPGADAGAAGAVASGGKGAEKKKKKNAVTRSNEVQFLDDMWSELMAKGHLAGDERWIIGEDDDGRVTVVRF
ncbi:hypothetical protein B0T25DRAFT_347264 [Lasiosphaeria hispida]|uniref:F-box domain-containing protein n=1 Tax=Lasiosphaeria hispida TaxID=260671 RepID=A0AAJ0H6P3_9PEZI|nr:hypothetical protein B0T25DRAFT_347264 [Lasiosphaeria hispida]